MRKMREHCLDCGSHVVTRVEDSVMPSFNMEIISYACGATLKTLYSSNGNIGRAIHSGCCMIEEQVAPI